ncbi:MAG: hypothetical protein IKU23_00765 [Clostridia bacterium]|nr:hypothetical protein [Clostridia bacterium]
MENFINILKKLITADNIALLSVIVTALIFIFSRRAEIKYKQRDDKKAQYIKLISLLQKALKKDENGNPIIDDEIKSLFFDTGASLLMYGSKKIYRLYLLFREFSTSPLIKQCKYYDDKVIIFIISEIFVSMRKEVGLSNFNSIANNDALAFFVNDISCNPSAKTNAIEAKFRIKMIRFELATIDRTQFIWTKKLYFKFIKPIFAVLFIILKHFVIIFWCKIIVKLFSKFTKKNTPTE